MNSNMPAERLLREVTARYGSAEAFFEILQNQCVDPLADTIELPPMPELRGDN
ncbi:hypothetical protein ACWEO2_36760 [Nocardia sp. NPDC004278]|uniref:hypothetical protein n=1 Tax=Nocardia sp. NPDC005998 TaxID=3156894 RepID=UPI0033A0DEB4